MLEEEKQGPYQVHASIVASDELGPLASQLNARAPRSFGRTEGDRVVLHWVGGRARGSRGVGLGEREVLAGRHWLEGRGREMGGKGNVRERTYQVEPAVWEAKVCASVGG